MFGSMTKDILTAIALLGSLLVTLEVGFLLGRRSMKGRQLDAGNQLTVIEAGLLGLLGLLLGFSFSASASRFMERQDLVTQEANAIGTVYLRADLLDEPQASEMRSILEEYLQHQVQVSKVLWRGLPPDAEQKAQDLHARLWNAARDGVAKKPAAILAVLDPVNALIDLHSTRLAAAQKRLPAPILWLLILVSWLGMLVVGYGCGISGRQGYPMAVALAVLIAAALWTTMDLDNPRAGMIRLSDAALIGVKLERPPATLP
jgi:hypothetical protein